MSIAPLGPQAREAEDAYVVYDGAELPPVDADTVLLEQRYERTERKALGGEWSMADWIAADRARREAEGAFSAGGDTELVAPSWRLTPDALPKGAARTCALRAAAAGFEVRCQASIVYVTPTLYAASKAGEGGHTKGDLRYPDHDDTWWGVQAVLRRQDTLVAAFWAEWCTREQVGARVGTAFRDASTWDLVTKRDLCTKAGEFEDWLSVFAPPLVSKKSRQAGTS